MTFPCLSKTRLQDGLIWNVKRSQWCGEKEEHNYIIKPNNGRDWIKEHNMWEQRMNTKHDAQWNEISKGTWRQL